MRFQHVFLALGAALVAHCEVLDRLPLSFAPIPDGTYVAPVASNVTTLLDFIRSRDELSFLSSMVEETGGFVQALNTTPTWQYTFFAPSNTAFNNTGEYYETYSKTPKGKWWLGNLIQHHYVPNSKLSTNEFSTNPSRIQTSTYLYVGTQIANGTLLLNNIASVTEGNIEVTNGLVHVIDHILDPAAQIFQVDLPKASQSFIAGSCADPSLPYC
ncbi:FAS1 domain-containing protein [Penicillium malachiteum]|nr:FAS1 domain-containing protein [Penicillium malachiteum]